MHTCSKCTDNRIIKSGFMKGKQRYKCKNCLYHFTVVRRSGDSMPEQRKKALNLYLEGLGFRSIGRALDFSHVAIYHWICAFGERVEVEQNAEIEIIEMDEMHSYVGHKKTTVGSGLQLID